MCTNVDAFEREEGVVIATIVLLSDQSSTQSFAGRLDSLISFRGLCKLRTYHLACLLIFYIGEIRNEEIDRLMSYLLYGRCRMPHGYLG